MKLSNKRFKLVRNEEIRAIIREKNINIRLDEILEKVQKNPDEKLSQEETELLKNNVAKLQEVKDYWIAMMIKATGDKDFIKACLEDKNFEFDRHGRVALIIATQDINYIKESIDDKSEEEVIRVQLVEALSSLTNYFDYMKYVTDFVRAEASSLNPFYKVQLISSIGKHPQMDMDTYIMYLEGRLREKELLLRQVDKISLIEKLRELEDMQVKTPGESGRFKLSRYEWQILRWMKENKIDLEEFAKSRLIRGTKNPIFYTICLYEDKLLDSAGKAGVLRGFEGLENVTANQYSKIVWNAVQDETLQLEEVDKFDLLEYLRDMKELAEPTEELEIRGKKIKISQYDRIISILLLKDKKIISSSSLKAELLASISSLDIIDIFVSAQGILEHKDKIAVILGTNNEEYIRRCIENKKIYLGNHGKVDLILKLNNPKAAKVYIESEELLEDKDKVDLMIRLGDEAYTKVCLANPNLDISLTQRAIAIIYGIKDETYRRNCLTDDMFAIDLATKEMLVNAIGSEEDKEKWNRRIVKVKNISQLSLEELRALPEDAIIKTEDDIYKYYKRDEYVQVRKKMNEILEGIESPISGDEDTELRAFLEVSKRLAMHISYDKFAMSKAGKKDYKLQKECRNLYGGLMNGECVCAGYACILKNALACLGIEAKYIDGGVPCTNFVHAWNQVKIGGKWYNTDLTWERDKIVRTGIASKDMLKSDKEFENHKMFSENRPPAEEVCSESMRDREDLTRKTNKSQINKKEQDETEI